MTVVPGSGRRGAVARLGLWRCCRVPAAESLPRTAVSSTANVRGAVLRLSFWRDAGSRQETVAAALRSRQQAGPAIEVQGQQRRNEQGD